jgi:hypothetical protein
MKGPIPSNMTDWPTTKVGLTKLGFFPKALYRVPHPPWPLSSPNRTP